MHNRQGKRQKYVRLVAILLAFAVALPFAVVTLAQSGGDESDSLPESVVQSEKEDSSSIPQAENTVVSPTSLPFTIEQQPNNKAPTISLEGPNCLGSDDRNDLVSIAISVSDIDDTSVLIDLSALVEEESINLTSFINEGTELTVPGIASATFPIPITEQSYILLVSHATDEDGAKSEAALVIPFRC